MAGGHAPARTRGERGQAGGGDDVAEGHAHQDEPVADLRVEEQREVGEQEGQVQGEEAQRRRAPQEAGPDRSNVADDLRRQQEQRGLHQPEEREVVPDAARVLPSQHHHAPLERALAGQAEVDAGQEVRGQGQPETGPAPGQEGEGRAVPSDVRHRRADAGKEVGRADRDRRRDGGDEQGDGGAPPSVRVHRLRGTARKARTMPGISSTAENLVAKARPRARPRIRPRAGEGFDASAVGRSQGQEMEQREGHVHRGQACRGR